MDYTSRDEDKGADSPSNCLFSYLEVDLSLQNIECLFLGFVDMLWRTLTCYDHLKQRVGTSGILFRDLVCNRRARYLNDPSFARPTRDGPIYE